VSTAAPDPPPEPGEIVVIGIGNELMRDEGVGMVVARNLKTAPLPAGVRVVEAAVGGLDLLFEMEAAAYAIIVDAADMRLAPGAVRFFSPDDLETSGLTGFASLHQIGLLDVLELGKLTGLTAEVLIVGIQPQEVAPGLGLTGAARQAAEEAAELVRSVLRDLAS